MRKLDPRAKKLAEIVVDHSTRVRRGDEVRISGEPFSLAFMEEMAKMVIDRGGYPSLEVKSPNLTRYTFDHGSMRQVCHVPGSTLVRFKEIDVNIVVYDKEDPLYLRGVDPKKLQGSAKSTRIFSDIAIGDGLGNPGVRWCAVGFPSAGTAKQGGMTLKEYADILYSATNIDWAKATDRMRQIKSVFDGAGDVHIVVPGKTDLHLSLKGRGGAIGEGRRNMPDGEVYYGPVEDSASGTIQFVYPSIRDGNLVEEVQLTYKDGKLIDFTAKKGMGFLEKMLSMNGMDRIGELGIGSNPGITRYMQNLLFDEKIDGTVHIAVGMSYSHPLSQGGGKNEAEAHWDLVCELRKVAGQPGGELYVDGKLVQKNGVWQFK